MYRSKRGGNTVKVILVREHLPYLINRGLTGPTGSRQFDVKAETGVFRPLQRPRHRTHRNRAIYQRRVRRRIVDRISLECVISSRKSHKGSTLDGVTNRV